MRPLLFDRGQGLIYNILRQRNVTILDDYFLTLLGQNHLDELTLKRSQRLVRRLVHVDVQETSQWVSTSNCVFGRRFYVIGTSL
jgi:hypothetical protein